MHLLLWAAREAPATLSFGPKGSWWMWRVSLGLSNQSQLLKPSFLQLARKKQGCREWPFSARAEVLGSGSAGPEAGFASGPDLSSAVICFRRRPQRALVAPVFGANGSRWSWHLSLGL